MHTRLSGTRVVSWHAGSVTVMRTAAVAVFPPSSPDPLTRGVARYDPHGGWYITFDVTFRTLPEDEIRFDNGQVFSIRTAAWLRLGDTLNLYEMGL